MEVDYLIMEKKRESNFELLRILAMILIVIFHVQVRGPHKHLNDGLFALPILYKRLYILEFGVPLGMIGNSLFLMISGYFMANTANINLGKISKKLLFQVGFATLVLTSASTIFITWFKHNIGSIVTVGLDLFTDEWWFIGYYLLVIVIACFLNRYLSNIDKVNYGAFLITIFAIVQFQWSAYIAEGIAPGLRTLLIGIFYFYLGGYIKKYNPFKSVKFYYIFLIILVTYIFRFMTSYNTTSMNIEQYISNGSTEAFAQTIHGYSNFETSVVILTICVFELFNRLKLPHSKIINFIGSSTLMIYFIHDNDFTISLYNDDNWMEALSEGAVPYLLKWFAISAQLFIAGIIAYSIYYLLSLLIKKQHS